MADKGILLAVWGGVNYGYMAYNFAMSVKHYSPSLPIYLITDQTACHHLSEEQKKAFDFIEVMGEPVSDPGLFKASIYNRLPFDFTLYLDVDALAIGDVSQVLDRCIEDYEADPDGKFYRCHVHDWYDQDSPDEMPMMYWAKRSVIWDYYGLSDHRFPGTQSSIQFIAKSERTEQFFSDLQALMTDPMPLEMLSHKWGGGQPDELYLNVQIARSRISPDLNDVMWFCDNKNKTPHILQSEGYSMLSYFGVRERIKSEFIRYYDGELDRIMKSKGLRHVYRIPAIFNGKHAAKKAPNHNIKKKIDKSAAQMKADKEIFEPKSHKITRVFTSYYKARTQARQNELIRCIQMNIDNPFIDEVVLFSEIDVPVHSKKLKVISSPRMLMGQMAHAASDMTAPDEIAIMCNSDIYMDHTIGMLSDLNLNQSVLCLSRWDWQKSGDLVHYDYEYSQDTWIWQGKLTLIGGDYPFGLLGCDNKFAHDLAASGYRVLNPSRHIKTVHIHQTNERNYSERTRLPRPYLNVEISDLTLLRNKRLLLRQPGKVGDLIICLPIAKHYHDQGYTVDWQCPEQYHAMLHRAGYVNPVTQPDGYYDHFIDLSFGLDQTTPLHKLWLRRRSTGQSFVSLKYELANVPITELSKLHYNRDLRREDELYVAVTGGYSEPYALVHDNSDYGAPADITTSLRVVKFRPVSDYTIFDWRKVIEQATEIHCIDSSLVNFADRCDVKGEMYYYPTDKVPMKGDRTILNKEWKTLEYANS